MNNLQTLQQRLGYQFHNTKLLIEALTHKSYKQPYNNERLEFLGDAVLDLVVGEYLYTKFPKFDEGDLSKMRASLVNEDGFALLANYVHLGEHIYLSNAEENNNGRTKSSLLANAYEAVMGAIYLESGLDSVRNITIELLEQVYEEISLTFLFKDYKTSLQELTQARYGVTPEYQLLAAHGPDHKKEFDVAVLINGKHYAKALGKSKKHAQQEAAKQALEILLGDEK
jgi:ribonuclease-3